ncbi:2-oxo acid dehydrogenase subunit E2, partial [uncultured Corynebacterium sp.]|uniref:2-oxo acid dehydrogenase subunit E2 n=1 Tax=uncultured Corynebacterium sp. TaxID=159447 RepID=UPI002596C402
MSSDSTFGQNDWLVDEMYQQYRENPSSVDPEWRELFERNGAPQTATGAKNVSPAPSPAKAGDAKESREKTDPKVARTTGAPSQDGRQTKVDQAAAEAASKRSKVLPKPKQSPLQKIADVSVEPGERQLKGIYKTIAKNMDESLSLPTATSVRDMPVKLMFENRALVNDHLKRTRGGKISFTHIIGYAIVKAAQLHPGMNVNYKVKDNKPFVVQPEHINLGLAIDLPQKDGSRALVVAAIKECEKLSFDKFVDGYEDIVNRARDNKLTMDDFSGVTIQLTNPGGIGTRHSIPRLTTG